VELGQIARDLVHAGAQDILTLGQLGAGGADQLDQLSP
jgi:hypothetical protein